MISLCNPLNRGFPLLIQIVILLFDCKFSKLAQTVNARKENSVR